MGLRSHVEIFVTDYPTPDGSAVRDFVHVSDLADVHVVALHQLLRGRNSFVANLGTGRGISVLEVIRVVQRVARTPIATHVRPRRLGDPATLVADPSLAASLLGWRPKLSAIENIVASAWQWHQRYAPCEESEADRAMPRTAFIR
jgi:UDP-glucose 4-epimerase